jgi:hypothetical protein
MLDIDKYKDENNIFKKIWDKKENIELLPKFYNNIIEVDFKEFKNKVYENNLRFANETVESLLSGDIYILKNAFTNDYIDKVKKQTILNWKNIKSEFHKIYDGCPNFYRNIDTSLSNKYAFKQIKKTQYFFPWNQDYLNLYEEIYKRWRVLKYLSGYYENVWETNTPKDGIIDRIQIVKYPPNSGSQELHQDPYIYQKFFISLYLSKKGKHFLDGGVYLVDSNNQKFSLEDKVNVGDLSFGFGTIYHGVDVPIPIINTENDEYMGRWWLGIYSTESDYNQKKHTGNAVSL